MSAIIEIQGLSKTYESRLGRRLAVKELTLSIEEGSVFGFIGPNGAGKTTTMRILTTLLEPTAGKAWVAGCSIARDPRGVRRAIGYMPDFFGVYNEMKVWEYSQSGGAPLAGRCAPSSRPPGRPLTWGGAGWTGCALSSFCLRHWGR